LNKTQNSKPPWTGYCRAFGKAEAVVATAVLGEIRIRRVQWQAGNPLPPRHAKLAKKRGYVTYGELNKVLPSEKFSPEQIQDVLDQLSEMGITAVEAEEDEAEGGDLVEASQTRAVVEREEATDDQLKTPATSASVMDSRWAVYGGVFEGYWDGTRWRSAGGVPCEPTHWMPLPSPPLVLVSR
jgi:hypothetical protein